jgi:DNA-binding response OmpR family regulator
MRPKPTMPNVLVIDSHAADREAAERYLQDAGFSVTVAADAGEGMAAARAIRPDAVLLDTALPGVDGVRLIDEIRREATAGRIVVLTAADGLDEKLRAFALGADDYVLKPCHWLEVAARVRAVCRRSATVSAAESMVREEMARADARAEARAAAEPVLSFGDVTLHPLARTVRRAGVEVRLRPKEYDLLAALVERRGEVVTRQRLLAEVWGYAPGTTTRTVDSHVFTLRRKLEPDPEHPSYIVTVNRFGYRLDATGAAERRFMIAS